LAVSWIALAFAPTARAAIFGVPTNLNAAGEVCTAVGTPAGCTAVSADPPGWLVLERTNSGSANGDVVKQIRFFVEVTGTTLDIRVFDAGLSNGRDLGNPVTVQYRLRNPPNTATLGVLTIGADVAGLTEDRLARFSCQDAGGTAAVFTAPNAAASATNRVWGAGTGGNCVALSPGLYIFEVTAQTTAAVEGRNAFGVEFRNAAGTPYNAYTIGAADDTINAAAAADTSMIVGGVAGDRPTANVSGAATFYAYVNRGCSIEASNFDLDANNAEGNGSVATIVDTLGTAANLTRSNNDNVAATTVTVEASTIANPISNNYGMYTLTTQLDEWATAQNHVDWRIADFQGATAGVPANLPRHPSSPIRSYLPNAYSACGASGCALTAPQEPVLAGSAVLVSGENPPLPGGATTRFAITATVANPSTTTAFAVQITIPALAANGITFVSQTSTIDGRRGRMHGRLAGRQLPPLHFRLARGRVVRFADDRRRLPASRDRAAGPDRGARRRQPASQHHALGAVRARVGVERLSAHGDARPDLRAVGERGHGRRHSRAGSRRRRSDRRARPGDRRAGTSLTRTAWTRLRAPPRTPCSPRSYRRARLSSRPTSLAARARGRASRRPWAPRHGALLGSRSGRYRQQLHDRRERAVDDSERDGALDHAHDPEQ
jgi:hypothetical protein